MDSSTLIIIVGVLTLFLGGALYYWLAPGPRRSRAMTRARQLLVEGLWQEALQIVDDQLRGGSLPKKASAQLHTLMGECLQEAGEIALGEGRFEDALQHFTDAAPLQDRPPEYPRELVLRKMMAKVRAGFSNESAHLLRSGTDPTFAEPQDLITRVLMIDSDHAEAYFWQAMIQIKKGELDQAHKVLENAHRLGESKFVDPPFYLGAMLYGQGRYEEALRTLSEANRIDAGCPFVAWLMGRCMVAANSDPAMAVRVLQRALGQRGFGLWKDRPERAWIEAFPDGKSWVRRLAEKHRFICPIFGGDLSVWIRWGELALAQALYRQGQFQESADLYQHLLDHSPPSLPLLRGLGLSMVKLKRYDQAFKHLRAALDMSPEDPYLNGYVALCGALGETRNPEDKPNNIAWAFQQFARFDIIGEPEWAEMLSQVHQEARAHQMSIPGDAQVLACHVLASVLDTTPEAAATYSLLAQQHPEAVLPVHAFLYSHAVQEHGVQETSDLDLLERTFLNVEEAKSFYEQQGWDFTEVEYLFLERSAAISPGRFPRVMGETYPAQGERFLLTRSQEMEQTEEPELALNAVETLLALSPGSLEAHDRLACLHYRQGKMKEAAEALARLEQLSPDSPIPSIRRAVIEHRQHRWAETEQSLEKALQLTQGERRASVAFLGAKLALSFQEETANKENNGASTSSRKWEQAESYLERALENHPEHLDALCTLVSLRGLRNDFDGLKALLPRMGNPEIIEERYFFLTALCHLAAGNAERVLEWAERAKTDPDLRLEAEFLKVWANLHLKNRDQAVQSLQLVAKSESIAGDHARALLGGLSFLKGTYVDAVKWWGLVKADKREKWKCDEPLQRTMFLTALTALHKGKFEQAAERFQEAGRLGLREKNLGALIRLALLKEAMRLYYQ